MRVQCLNGADTSHLSPYIFITVTLSRGLVHTPLGFRSCSLFTRSNQGERVFMVIVGSLSKEVTEKMNFCVILLPRGSE